MDKIIITILKKMKVKVIYLKYLFIKILQIIIKLNLVNTIGIHKKIKNLIIPLVDAGVNNFKIFDFLRELV